MDKYKFDCNSNNAPAYSCNKPDDNSGEYYKAQEVVNMVQAIRCAVNYPNYAEKIFDILESENI